MSHPLSPLLDHCPEGLPRAAYQDRDWFAQEQATVWARNWVCAGRLSDVPEGTVSPIQIGGGNVLLCHTDQGMRAFHNTCRHRGAELCRSAQPLGKRLSCPYHAWAYSSHDGRLLSTAHAHPTADFRREDHGLLPVALQVWNGFIFLNLGPNPGPLQADMPLSTFDNWPMAGLVTGHRHTVTLECNWKTFWENYSECLHCPGVHPELSDMVPIYRQGVMAPNEAQGWTPDTPEAPRLKDGASTWTADGAACGPVFAGLTAGERDAGYNFVTLWPSAYVVAHVDHVRSVRLEPLGPEQTRLIAEWHFPADTLAQPGFDAARVAAFATLVLDQDAAAAEMNQRGMRSPAFTAARLMPEEYEIHRFHQWLLEQMQSTPARVPTSPPAQFEVSP